MTFDHRSGIELPFIPNMMRAGSWPGCREKRWVSLASIQLRSRLEFPEYEEEGGFYASCGHCDNCAKRKVDAWVGRIIGEAQGSEHCYFVTLTVGGDRLYGNGLVNEKARQFCKADVQNYFKRLKKYLHHDWWEALVSSGQLDDRGDDAAEIIPPRLRYFYVGERGEKGTQRTHYHAVVFLNGVSVPDQWLYRNKGELYYEPRERFFHGKMDESAAIHLYKDIDHLPGKRTYWPWGLCQWKRFDSGAAQYLAGYLNKSAFNARGVGFCEVMRPGYTTKPVFGGCYADVWASYAVEDGLTPQDNLYTVPPREGYSGTLHRFAFPKSCMRVLFNTFAHRWEAEYGERNPPWSEQVARFFASNELRKLGTPQAELCRAQFFAIARQRLRSYGQEISIKDDGSFVIVSPPLTVEKLASVEGAIVGSGRNQIGEMRDSLRIDEMREALVRNPRTQVLGARRLEHIGGRGLISSRWARRSQTDPISQLRRRHGKAVSRWRKLGVSEEAINTRLIGRDAIERLRQQS